MGRRGPQKKPSTISKLQGNPGRRPLNPREPEPEIAEAPNGIADAPEWLDDRGREWWARVAKKLYPVKLLTVLDIEALAKYCDAVSQWLIARDFMVKHGHGFVVKDKFSQMVGMKRWPQVDVYKSLLPILQRYEAAFGMTPA